MRKDARSPETLKVGFDRTLTVECSGLSPDITVQTSGTSQLGFSVACALPRGSAPAQRDLQPEAHCVENIKNCREVWFVDHRVNASMNAWPGKARFLRKVRDIAATGGGANGVTTWGRYPTSQALDR